MGLSLLMYLGVLALGAIIGYKDKISGKLEANLDKIQNLCLLFLLFVMGITIGINEEVISNIFSIGFKALIISIFTISFSVIAVRLIKKIVTLESDQVES